MSSVTRGVRHGVVLIGLLSLLAPAGTAGGQVRDQRNAATWYRRAIDELSPLTEEEFVTIDSFVGDPSTPPTPELRALLQRQQRALDFVRRGTQQEYSDYGLDYSQGFEMLLPHLGPLRGLARRMRADALLRLHDGDVTGAVEGIGSMYRLSEHLADDSTLISSLVGMSVFKLTDSTLDRVVDGGHLDAAAGARLLRSTERFDTDDPFGVVEAMVVEQEIAVTWLGRKAEEFETPQEMLGYLGLMLAAEAPPPEAMEDYTFEDLDRDLERYDGMMNRVVEIFANPDEKTSKAELEQLEQELREGEHGELARFWAPSLLKVHEHMHRSRDMVRDRISMLEQIAAGEVDPEESANAAVFYLRALEMFASLPEAHRQAILSAPPDGPLVDEATIAALEEAESIVAVLREGASKKRCDFAFVRNSWRLHVVPKYGPGLRQLTRLLLVDARRLDAAGARDAAVDRLATAFRMAGHLGEDEPLLTSVIAHETFRDAAKLTTALVADEPSEHRDRLALAVARISRKDPFGYIGSVAALRPVVAKLLGARLSSEDDPEETAGGVQEYLGGLQADEVLFLAAALEALQHEQVLADMRAHDAALADVPGLFDREALQKARDDAGFISSMLVAGELPVFTGRDPARIAQLEERLRTARSELRALTTRLAPPPDPTEANADDHAGPDRPGSDRP